MRRHVDAHHVEASPRQWRQNAAAAAGQLEHSGSLLPSELQIEQQIRVERKNVLELGKPRVGPGLVGFQDDAIANYPVM